MSIRLFPVLAATALMLGAPSVRAEQGLLPPATYSFASEGAVVPCAVDREIIASWLPVGLTLAEAPPFVRPDRHPVLLVLGTQTNFARHRIATIHPPFGRRFQEAFVIVPYLRASGGSPDEDVSYYARIYVGNERAKWWGVRLFGWPKVSASIAHTDDRYRIDGDAGARVDAAFDLDTRTRLSTETASFQLVQGMLDQTTVLSHDGRLERFQLSYHFAPESIEGVDTRLEWSDGFMPNLTGGRINVGGLGDRPFGAFLYRGTIEGSTPETAAARSIVSNRVR